MVVDEVPRLSSLTSSHKDSISFIVSSPSSSSSLAVCLA